LRFRQGVALPPRAYIDTNLFLHTRDVASHRYRSASACLAELIRQSVELNVSSLLFDELWWALFRVSFRMLQGEELTSLDYKRNQSIWRDNWPRIRQITEELLDWPRLRLLDSPTSETLLNDVTSLLNVNPLTPRDAFHLALALHHDIDSFVTADTDFDDLVLPAGRSVTVVKF